MEKLLNFQKNQPFMQKIRVIWKNKLRKISTKLTIYKHYLAKSSS